MLGWIEGFPQFSTISSKIFGLIINYTTLLAFLSTSFLPFVSSQYASMFPSPTTLINKSPSLGSWLAVDANLTGPGGRLPISWNRQTLGWTGGIRVDGNTYSWSGDEQTFNSSQTLAASITPTRSVFTLKAGPVNLNLTYLTPIELSDWTLQSLPFGYLAIDVWSNDGNPHSIQIYSDISGEWITGDPSNVIVWKTSKTPLSTYHQAERSEPVPMGETNGIAEDSTIYFAMSSSMDMTWQTSPSIVARNWTFNLEGRLDDTTNEKWRAVNDATPVLAFATDLGTTLKTTSPIVFALGLVRDPVVTYNLNGILQNRTSLFWTRWKTIDVAIDDFLKDYPNALARAVELDQRIMKDANKVSENYSDIVAASLRQTMAALEYTAFRLPDGGFDGQVRVFMKDFGTSMRVNPVDTLYAAFPAYLYLNATLAGKLLEPLLEFQASRIYPYDYASSDIGSWPIASGNITDESSLGIDDSGSMLVMVLAHAQKSGDSALIIQYHTLLKRWADYLVANALLLDGYTSTNPTYLTTTNLALKGITGIWAMSKISRTLEPTGATKSNLTEYYLTTAKSYYEQWQSKAISTSGSGNHITSEYGSSGSDSGSWGLVYNLYAPKLLNSDLVPQTVFDDQAAWYRSLMPTAPAFGFPFDQNFGDTVKAHWTLLTAATVSNTPASHDLIAQVHRRTFSQQSDDYPNPAMYHGASGAVGEFGGISSPAMGAAFSLLALNLPDRPIRHSTLPHASNKKNLGVILGGVIGGLFGLLLFGVGVSWCFVRMRRRRQRADEKKGVELMVVDYDELVKDMDLGSGSFGGSLMRGGAGGGGGGANSGGNSGTHRNSLVLTIVSMGFSSTECSSKAISTTTRTTSSSGHVGGRAGGRGVTRHGYGYGYGGSSYRPGSSSQSYASHQHQHQHQHSQHQHPPRLPRRVINRASLTHTEGTVEVDNDNDNVSTGAVVLNPGSDVMQEEEEDEEDSMRREDT